MLIKNIKIKNFRQYKNVELELSNDPDKNLTVVLGENGYGKTTLIRAFLWCLYRENTFKNDILLNQDIADVMSPNDEKTVKVEIDLNHGGKDYRITTKEKYSKDHNGVVFVSSRAKTTIIKDGYTIPAGAIDIEISKILKKDLKDYFFYDGENNKIESASTKGSLKDAISQMMGIQKIEALRSYFQPNGKSSVIYSLTKQLKSDDLQLEPLQNELNALIDEKNELESLVESNNAQIEVLTEKMNQKEAIITANKDVQTDQSDKIRLQKEISDNQNLVDSDYLSMISMLNGKKTNPLLKILFAKCFENHSLANLSEESSFGKEDSLSHISEEAIDQLIKRGKCLCGAIIKNGNDAYKHLIESKEHMEPHDFGKHLSDFVTAEESNVEYSVNLADQARESANSLLDRIEAIEINKEALSEITQRIAGRPDVGSIQLEVNRLKGQINQLSGANNYIRKTQLPELNNKIAKKRSDISGLSDQTKENELIKKCIEYANVIYKISDDKIKKAQVDTRNYLQAEVSEIFDKIYHGNRKLVINNNFDITTLTNNQQLDNSTGTETVKNFAFVAGLLNSIKNHMIKDDANRDGNDIDEVYPLIMDAPFSDIDAEHIKNVCSTLPNYCDQICIVVIEKDYDVAIDGIKDRIGKLYRINKRSETDDTIEEVELDV